jgi:hypothetical protein
MNKTLANAAIAAVLDPSDDFVTQPGWCSKFVRQVVESVYGQQYAKLFQSSAKRTGIAFQQQGDGFPRFDAAKHGGLQEGDILFKVNTSGEFGHVGILTARGVAENSSTGLGRVHGAKGFRSLAEYGRYDVIGRLPAPEIASDRGPRLIVAVPHASGYVYSALRTANLSRNSFYVDGAELASILDAAPERRVILTGRTTLREYLMRAGIEVEKLGDHRDDATDPRYYVFLKAIH